MGWENRKKEKNLENFYLEIPEEKIYYPIDFLWNFNNGKTFSLDNNWSVDLEEGKSKKINISEIKIKKNRLHGR
jgi:hypothetical protein